MARDYELDRLFEAKQSAWQEQDRARTRMNDAWEELQRLRDRYGSQIDSLRAQHARMYDRTQDMSRDIDNAFNSGDRDEGFRLIEEVKEVRAEMQDLPDQWRGMIAEIKAAQERQEQYRSEFQTSKRAFIDAKDAFNDHRDRLKAQREQRASRAGVPYQHLDDVKVVEKLDGTTQYYYGGLGGGDGALHGHTAEENDGEITYRRRPFEDHGPQNFRGSKYLSEDDTPQRRRSERNENRNRRYEEFGD